MNENRSAIIFFVAAIIFAVAALVFTWGHTPADASLPRCDDMVAKANANPHDRCREMWR